LGITPRQALHDMAAGHKDEVAKKVSLDIQYSKGGFHCDCNSMVATSPFSEPQSCTFPGFKKEHSESSVERVIHFFDSEDFQFSLRGPPFIS